MTIFNKVCYSYKPITICLVITVMHIEDLFSTLGTQYTHIYIQLVLQLFYIKLLMYIRTQLCKLLYGYLATYVTTYLFIFCSSQLQLCMYIMHVHNCYIFSWCAYIHKAIYKTSYIDRYIYIYSVCTLIITSYVHSQLTNMKIIINGYIYSSYVHSIIHIKYVTTYSQLIIFLC